MRTSGLTSLGFVRFPQVGANLMPNFGPIVILRPFEWKLLLEKRVPTVGRYQTSSLQLRTTLLNVCCGLKPPGASGQASAMISMSVSHNSSSHGPTPQVDAFSDHLGLISF